VGYAFNLWFLDPLGGVVLSLYVIFNWSQTANEHICNLAGQAATADQRNILLYLTMRFAKTIKHIQGLQAYHVGDKLNVEVDIVLDERTSLRDSHDLGESLQYVIESVPEGKFPTTFESVKSVLGVAVSCANFPFLFFCCSRPCVRTHGLPSIQSAHAYATARLKRCHVL
jgi:hypothetical protein